MNEIFFDKEFFEKLPFSERNNSWIRLSPYAVQMAPDGIRPILILKDKTGVHSLPVPLNPLEAGIALTQSNKTIAPLTPHRVTESLLQTLRVSVESCVFCEIKGSFQFVNLKLKEDLPKSAKKRNSPVLKVRADEAMSFCLHFNVPLYATEAFMERSRVLASEIQEGTRSLMAAGALSDKSQRYIQ